MGKRNDIEQMKENTNPIQIIDILENNNTFKIKAKCGQFIESVEVYAPNYATAKKRALEKLKKIFKEEI